MLLVQKSFTIQETKKLVAELPRAARFLLDKKGKAIREDVTSHPTPPLDARLREHDV